MKKELGLLVCHRCGETNELSGSKTHHVCTEFDMQIVPFVPPDFKVRPWQKGFEDHEGPMTSVSASPETDDPALFAPFARMGSDEEARKTLEERKDMRRGYGRQ